MNCSPRPRMSQSARPLSLPLRSFLAFELQPRIFNPCRFTFFGTLSCPERRRGVPPVPIPFVFILFHTLLHTPKTQLFYFESLPHSCHRTPGGGGYTTDPDHGSPFTQRLADSFFRFRLVYCRLLALSGVEGSTSPGSVVAAVERLRGGGSRIGGRAVRRSGIRCRRSVGRGTRIRWSGRSGRRS
jgi:hypothetical protein